MKWTRSKGNICEYSTGYVGPGKYISMSHTTWSNHYWYAYSVNGEEILHGNFDANSWDEAEQIAVKDIRESLSRQAKHLGKLLNEFDTEVNANETLD